MSSRKNVHFDDELGIHMSSKNYDENGYGHSLNLSIISL